MVQFKDVLTGAETRSYTRAVDYQRCLRVAGKHNDFEEVGRTPRHHTLFEMLGNWCFGDYFKREAIHWAWDFLTRDLGIPRRPPGRHDLHGRRGRLGRSGATRSACRPSGWPAGAMSTTATTTTSGGWPTPVRADRAARSTSTAGAQLSEGPECMPDHSEHCPRWLEIWNLVFMEFDQRPDGRVPLPFTSVDTGMGLERLASVLQQVPTNYDTDLFTPIHARMRELLGHDPDAFETERFSYQVIADHSRAVTFLIGDDVLPSNEGRGYVLRKLLRRAVRHGRLLGRREPFMAETAAVVIEVMGEAYPHLVERRDEILGRHRAARRRSSRGRSTRDGPARGRARGRSPTRERVVGRRPEDLPADAPQSSRRPRVPAPRHLWLPDRPDRRARRRIRRRRRPRRLRRRRSPSSATAAAPGRRRSCRSMPSRARCTARSRRAPATRRFLGYETTTRRRPRRRDRPRRDGVRRADRSRRSRGRPRPDAVLRRGRRPGRRPGRPPRAGRRERAVHGHRHAAARSAA